MMRAEDWARMPWHARQRYLERQRRAARQTDGAPVAAPPPMVMVTPRISRYRGTWTVFDGVCTAKFGNEAAARWFIRQLETRQTTTRGATHDNNH